MTSKPKTQKSDQEWRDLLTPQQYAVLREHGTERAFSGEYVNTKTPGVYRCAACGNALFSSDTKYNSRSGWPSFYDVVEEGNVELREDLSHGMRRVEVVCGQCEGHLGHLFEDGPRDKTGLRYCINSLALDLDAEDDES